MPLVEEQLIDTAEENGFPQNNDEYKEIESLVMTYKLQFDEEASREEIALAKKAAEKLIQKFDPLIKKYLNSIKCTHIDFDDPDTKRFVLCFVRETSLKKALRSTKQSAQMRHEIYRRFNFVTETYGRLSTEEIMIDLQMLLLVLAKRYKDLGRNFCAYLYNTYRYEVSRHIKKFIKNPQNIEYKKFTYEDYMQTQEDIADSYDLEDQIYENNMGVPDTTWINGTSCSEGFQKLTPFERKLIVKYYIEDYNDRQIAETFAMHINTCNQKRRQAVIKLARILGVPEEKIKRNRKSGKKALFFNT